MASTDQRQARVIEIPNEMLAGDDIKYLFEHPDVQKRGTSYFREAIRYFHEPFNIHQENIENGELHKKLQSITFSLVRANSKECLNQIVEQKVRDWIERFETPTFLTNLFDEIRLLIVLFFVELLFGKNVPSIKFSIYLESSANFHNTLKGKELRSIVKRLKMYEEIKWHLETSDRVLLNKEYCKIHSHDILAKHLGGVFFHTGVVQTTELICHTLVEIYRNSEIQDKLQQFVKKLPWPASFDEIERCDYLDYVLNESLRLFPEFGRTNREVTRPVTIKDIRLEEGTVVYLNFRRSHQLHWDDPEIFRPDRWDNASPQTTPKEIQNSHFIPFGVGSRRCPAEAFARNTTKAAIVAIMKYVNLTIPENFVHTRRLPQGVPVVIALNAFGQALRADLDPNSVCKENLVADLEQQQHSVDTVDELAGLTLVGIVKKIATNLKRYRGFSIVAFYPLITGVHIWLSFQAKRIQRRLR